MFVLNKIMFEKQIFRFLLVGFLNTILSYIVYISLLYLGIYYILALLISYIVGITNSYTYNKKWTFKSKGGSKREFSKFVLVYGITFSVNSFLLLLFVEKLMLGPNIGQVFALSIVTMISFFGHKYWSFRS